MQIHELNNFTGTLGSGAYLAIDDGTDTGKISSQGLLAATEARIDNIIAGPAPSAEEIVDARLGADGVTYPSLGDAIRDQFTDVKSELSELFEYVEMPIDKYQQISKVIASNGTWSVTEVGRSIIIPRGSAKDFRVTANADRGTFVALLTSSTTGADGTPVSFASNYNGRITVSVNTTKVIELPNDCTHIFIQLVNASGLNSKPSSVQMNFPSKELLSFVDDDVKIFDYESIVWQQGTVTAEGAEAYSGYAIRSQLLPITAGTKLEYNGSPDIGGTPYIVYVCEYTSNGTFIKRSVLHSNTDYYSKVIDNPFVRFVFAHAESTGVTVSVSEGASFSLKATAPIQSKISQIESDVNTLEIQTDALNDAVAPKNLKSLLSFESGYYIQAGDGILYASANFSASDYFDVSDYDTITYSRLYVESSMPNHGVAFYDSSKQFISSVRSGQTVGESFSELYTANVPENAVYVRFSALTRLLDEFCLYDAKQYKSNLSEEVKTLNNKIDGIDYGRETLLNNMVALMHKNSGAFNVVSRSRLLTDIQWLPIEAVPKQYRNSSDTLVYGSFEPNELVTGIPYASQLRYELWMGKSISFETFLSALKNPNSVMYDFSRVNDGSLYRPGAWYSTVCSKAVGFCLNLKNTYANGQFISDPNISLVKTAGNYTVNDIRIGDILEGTNIHTAIVTDIVYDCFGDICGVEVSEAVTPTCRRKKWNITGYVDNFFDHFAGYDLLRYDLIDSVPPVDLEVLYPYISKTLGLNFGNKANYKSDDDIKLTLLKKVSNTINVIYGGDTTSTVDVTSAQAGDEVTLELTDAGWYTINFDGGNDADKVSLCLTDDVATFDSDTSVLTFSSSTGVLDMVSYCYNSYRSHISDVFPTASDISAGTMTLTVPDNAIYIHAIFKNQFGKTCIEIALS